MTVCSATYDCVQPHTTVFSTTAVGEVLGIQCTQHIEDLLRQKMDATIKEIAPQVFPNMYTIDFVPVCDIAHVPIGESPCVVIAGDT